MSTWSIIIDDAISKSNLSNSELSQQLGSSQQYISGIRNGRHRPSDELLTKLLKILEKKNAISVNNEFDIIQSLISEINQIHYAKSIKKLEQLSLALLFNNDRLFSKKFKQNHQLLSKLTSSENLTLLSQLQFMQKDDIVILEKFCDLLLNCNNNDAHLILNIFESIIESKQLKSRK